MKKPSPSPHHHSSTTSSSSISTSIEPPKGCLRFFLSPNPNSNTKPAHQNHKNKKNNNTSNKRRTPCPIYQCSSSSSSSSSSAKPKPKHLSSHPVTKANDCNTPTPPTNLDNSSSGGDSGKNKTPPIQPSLSPEIQQQPLLYKHQPLLFEHGSSSSSSSSTTAVTSTSTATAITTPCYAAGHVLSGVSDKRKGRPRGILSVIDDNNDCSSCSFLNKGNVFDTADDNRTDTATAASSITNILTVSTPREASVHWLLSPCKEEEEVEGGNKYAGFRRLEDASLPLHFSSASASSGPGFSFDTTPTHSPSAGDASNRNGRRKSPHLSSPSGAGELCKFHGFLEPLFDNSDVLSPVPTTRITGHFTPKEGSRRCNSANNSLSVDSLSGGNVMRTPNSDSGSEGWDGSPLQSPSVNCKKDQVDSELNPNVGASDKKAISSEGQFSTWDLASSSFQLDGLGTPVDSIDLSLFQKVLDSKVSWVSNSTADDNISQSLLRISWRDGLAGRIFDMDEYDSCRYLSDDEEDAVLCSPKLKPSRSPQHDAETTNGKTLNHSSDLMQLLESKTRPGQLGKENCPPNIPSLSVESISMDGNGLISSADSDWNLCYKNKLFEV